jgi:hypothetical protein
MVIALSPNVLSTETNDSKDDPDMIDIVLFASVMKI